MKKKQLTGMEYLRSRMEELGYNSLQEVAEHMNVNRGNLWRWWNYDTRPSIDMIPVFATVLQVPELEILAALEVI
ncbi:HTH_XRE domain containing protein [uncultured Caudovirales phage]|uniref:HTH_XRE domain containing protein n=1 Tax=uncultured Caudovirales phage TaxID=2100421 RepID=A0A6J5N3L2_9CAUD|nr:HTH_XRE domain containing protein [uncultured Caudovirales phage]